jgi:hypothetical protein
MKVQEYEINLNPGRGNLPMLGDPVVQDNEVKGVLIMISSAGQVLRGRFLLFQPMEVELQNYAGANPVVLREEVPDAEVRETVALLRHSHAALNIMIDLAEKRVFGQAGSN